MNNLDLVIKAINSKKPISFEYNKEGKAQGHRKGNPHALYLQQYKDPKKEKNTKLDLVQTGGVSDSKKEKPFPSFRPFFFSDITNIVIHEEEPSFEPLMEKYSEEKGILESMYNPESERYKEIIAKI